MNGVYDMMIDDITEYLWDTYHIKPIRIVKVDYYFVIRFNINNITYVIYVDYIDYDNLYEFFVSRNGRVIEGGHHANLNHVYDQIINSINKPRMRY